MNTEQMAEQALKEILERTLNGVDAATQFSKEQIPDVVAQLLLWHGIESFMFFIVGVAIVILVPVATKKLLTNLCLDISPAEAMQAYERGEKWTRYREGSGLTSNQYDEIVGGGARFIKMMIVLTALLPLCAGLVITLNNLEWLQIIVAPKLYLLEYAAELVK